MDAKAHHLVFALLSTVVGGCVPPSGNYSPFHANAPSSSVAAPGTQGWSTEPSRGEPGALRSESVRALGDMVRGKASLSAASMGHRDPSTSQLDEAL